MRRNHSILAPLLAALLCAGCAREPERQPAVARVGDSVLTPSDLAAVSDSLPSGSEALRAYVASWISSELLYQEAVRRGLADTGRLRRQLASLRRRLAVEALLDQVFGAGDTAAIGNDAVAAVYASGGPAFLLREDVANLSFVLFAERDPANMFRARILRGTSWQDAVGTALQDTLPANRLLQVATRQYFTRTNLYPEELWRLARTLPKNDVSFVVRTPAGYYVMSVHSYRQRGEMPDLDYCAEEIRDRLRIEQRRLDYERLLTALRGATPVEFNSGLLDSLAARHGNDGAYQ